MSSMCQQTHFYHTQVDDAEPPPKKTEVNTSHTEVPKKKPESSNGRRKILMEKGDGDKDKRQDSKKQKETSRPVVERFDSEARGKTVNAFKESDSWD